MLRIPNKIITVFSLGIMAMLNAGCSTPDAYDYRTCPRVVVLGDADRVTRMRKIGSTDIADALYDAQLGNIQGKCKYYDDHVDVEFTVDLTAQTGAAFTPGSIPKEEYFVAILDPKGRRLTKENFVTELNFDEGASKTTVTETLTPSIPLAEKENAAGYTVYVGLQLPAAELDKNRAGKE